MLNASIHGLSRAEALDIYDQVVSVFRPAALHGCPDQELLVGNAHAARLLRLRRRSIRTSCCSTRSSPSATRTSRSNAWRPSSRSRPRGKTIVFVSHSPTAIQAICDRACLLDRGRLLYDGTVDGGLTEYRRLTSASPHEVLGPVATRSARRAWHHRKTPNWHGIASRAGGGGWKRAPGCSTSCAARVSGRTSTSWTSVAAACRRPAGLLKFMEPYHYWGFEKSIELYIAGAHIELPRAGLRAELGHFIVNDDFDLSEARHPFDVAIASSLLSPAVAEQHCPHDRERDPGADARRAFLRDLGREPRLAGVRSHRAGQMEPRPTAIASPSTTASRCWRPWSRRSAARRSVWTTRTHPRGEAVMLITRRKGA